MPTNSVGIYLAQATTIGLVTASRFGRFRRFQEYFWLVGQLSGLVVNVATELWFYACWSSVLAVISAYQILSRRKSC